MEQTYKEVYFGEFCNKCLHKDVKEYDDPCDECLSNPMNLYSHRPVNWEEKK